MQSWRAMINSVITIFDLQGVVKAIQMKMNITKVQYQCDKVDKVCRVDSDLIIN